MKGGALSVGTLTAASGATITSGGLTVTAGGITVSAGTTSLKNTTITGTLSVSNDVTLSSKVFLGTSSSYTSFDNSGSYLV